MCRAAENVALSGEISRLREYVERGERESLMADVDILRGELLRVTESLERLQALPQVIAPSSRLQIIPNCIIHMIRSECLASLLKPPLRSTETFYLGHTECSVLVNRPSC